MADPPRPRRRALLVAGGVLLVVLLVVARGPVALLAIATVAVAAGIILAVPPLLRHDGIDWDWLPDRAQEVPPEPGIANLRRLLAPTATDTAAPAQLHDLVRAIADDRAGGGPLGDGILARYLDGPPGILDRTEADDVITELEALPLQENP